jgi:5'(3')-deoxyribonucleotidase
MQLEIKKFESAVTWMTNLIFNSVFTAERLHIVATKLINDIATSKRNGYELAREISKAIYFKPETNVQLNSVLKQHGFLTELVEHLKVDEKSAEIIEDLNELRNFLIPTLTVHVAANFKSKVKDLKAGLNSLIEKVKEVKVETIKELPAMLDHELMNGGENLAENFTGEILKFKNFNGQNLNLLIEI